MVAAAVTDIYKIDSILRRGDEAVSCLSKAIELDIGYRQKAQSEKDFANIRKMSEFKNLVSEPEWGPSAIAPKPQPSMTA